MTGRIRKAICEKISQIAPINNLYYELFIPARKAQSNVTTNANVLHLPLKFNNNERLIKDITKLKYDQEIINNVRLLPATGKLPATLEFDLQPQTYIETLLQQNKSTVEQLNSHIVFEFSSPNIAKPFHVGHLRSTIIGNVLANIHTHLGHKVTKLNYLGDWGTQFGMIQVGVDMLNITDELMRRQPIAELYRAYVTANQAAKTDDTIAIKARQYFTELETNQNPTLAKQWQKYRQYTIKELEQSYARLGVQFNQYDWESQYSQQQLTDVLQELAAKSLLFDEHDGRKIVQVDGRRIPIIKSDGSTLYLARDIAALIDRYARYNFERIYYVVDNAQTDHFNALIKTTAALRPQEMSTERVQHIKFGRIHGMSTRSGQAIFLRDVLNEACDIMLEKQLKSSTTKIKLTNTSSDYKDVADILGISAVIINDLKQRRQRDYDFDWHKILQVNGDTGIKLQYTHCRLNNLLENCNNINVDNIKLMPAYLNEIEAIDLLWEISRFEQSIWLAKEQFEACILVNYLFSLCNTTSRALKHLNVKNETNLLKQQHRILLFQTAKNILNKCMQILGLKPLNKM